MKKITLLVAFSLSILFANAQANEVKTKYNKIDCNGVSAEYVVDITIVEKTIEDEMKAKGFGKGKSSKGFTLYQGVNFNDISPDKIDLYVKTERKSKKEKEKSIITILISKGYDNFISSTTEPKMIAAAINYLNGLEPKFAATSLEAQIKEQEDLVQKEEKKQNNYIDDLNDLEKKKRDIEDDIVKKKNDIEKQKAEVEKQRQFLEALKARKKI